MAETLHNSAAGDGDAEGPSGPSERDEVDDLLDVDSIERALHVGAAREAVARAANDEALATSLVTLGLAAAFDGMTDEAMDAATAALGAASRTGDDDLVLRVRAGRLSIQQTLGDAGAMQAELTDLAADSERLERWDLLAVWLGALSDAAGAAGEIEEALAYLGRAGEAANRSEQPLLMAKVNLASSEWMELAGRLSEARALTEIGIAQLAPLVGGDDADLLQHRGRLGLLSFRLEDFAVAGSQLELAQREFARLGHALAAAQLDRNIGSAALHLGRIDEARTRFVGALDVARALGDRTEEGRVALELGELSRLTSDYEPARRWFHLAATIAGELGDEGLAASARSGLAMVTAGTGHWRDALADVHEAVARGRENGDRLGTVNGLAQAGQLQRLLGEVGASEASLREAVATAADAGYALGQANASHGLGFLCHLTGRLGEAHALLSRSMTFAFELDDRVGVANTFYGLSMVSLSAGRIDDAVAEAVSGIEVAREVGYRRLEQYLYHQLAAAALDRGDLADARQHLDDSAHAGQGVDDPNALADGQSLIGRFLVETGEPAKAELRLLDAYHRHRALEDRFAAAVDLRRLGELCLARAETNRGVGLLRASAYELKALSCVEELALGLGALAPALAADGQPDAPILAAGALQLLDRLAASLPERWDRQPFDARHREVRQRLLRCGAPTT